MVRTFLLGAAGIAVSALMLAGGFLAGQPQKAIAESGEALMVADSGEPLDRKAVEGIIRDYLLANPELLLEVQQALEAKQREAQKVAQLGIIADNHEDIFQSPHDGIVGNPNGKVTIVEFFDYNCGFCKRAVEDMQALTAEDPELRFVLKEFPILGPDSQKAAVVSVAFHKLMPEKYAEFHTQFLSGPGRATEAAAIKIAVSLGADEAKLREMMKDPSIADVIGETYELANKLAITGTPSYVIGNEVVFGAQGKDVLNEKLAAAKAACATASC